ncbi:MAG: hypothetical protein H6729_09750 [Deltaproteobacteria bacterium]|nr:hypothetical protein [Deltaproteobacteria bacterium]
MQTGKIERLELHHVDIPMPTALFPVWIPGYPQYRLHYTLLTVTTKDGHVGVATGPAFGRERAGLGDFIAQFLIGVDAYDLDAVHERLRQSSSLGWRNGWMELAFWDLVGHARGLPLSSLILERLGVAPKQPVPAALPVYASFRELRPSKVRAESFERLQRLGFKAAKVSVHAMHEADDVAHIEAVRSAAGPDFGLAVHAHQGWSLSLVEQVPQWSPERARRFADRAASLDYRWLQEPLPDDAWDDLAALSSSAPLPIAGGDIIPTLRLLKMIAGHGCYGLLTPDAVFAGLTAVVGTMRICLERGLDFSPACNTDGLGVAANAHVLAAWASATGLTGEAHREVRADGVGHGLGSGHGPGSAHGLGSGHGLGSAHGHGSAHGRGSGFGLGLGLEYPWEPPAMMPEHRDTLLASPIQVRADGQIDVPTGPGLGVELDARALQRYAERFYVTTPLRFASNARRAGAKGTSIRAPRSRDKRGTMSSA